MFRVLELAVYDTEGDVEISGAPPDRKWLAVLPDSIGELAFKYACRKE
jgi:hypothetical protein